LFTQNTCFFFSRDDDRRRRDERGRDDDEGRSANAWRPKPKEGGGWRDRIKEKEDRW
jgi:hypothetical protein